MVRIASTGQEVAVPQDQSIVDALAQAGVEGLRHREGCRHFERLAHTGSPPSGPQPPDWSEIVPEIGPRPGDIVITKRQWGAFYGTGLDLQLRRRGIGTLVYGGIATNFGVESTARDAYERGFEQVFVEDAMSGLTAGAHEFAITTIFPRMGRIRSTDDVLAAIKAR